MLAIASASPRDHRRHYQQQLLLPRGSVEGVVRHGCACRRTRQGAGTARARWSACQQIDDSFKKLRG
jgi:hypothetical protein